MPRADAPGKYAPLCAWLAALPAEQERAVLTLTAIEGLIGSALPTGAWLRAFWASSNVARHNWNRVGFRAQFARPDYHTGQVTFTRMTPGKGTFPASTDRGQFRAGQHP
jgi:hypothetical protein